MTPNRLPPTDAALERIVAIFDGLMQRLMATHAPELSAIEMTMSQTKAMYLVLASGPMRMSELAARLHVTSSTATGAVDRLVELGLLERHEDPADRRQVVVSATPTAASTLEHFRELNSRRMREIIGRLGAEDLAVVERALRLLDDSVASESTALTTTTVPATRGT